jgi:probable addiction module antidote protein
VAKTSKFDAAEYLKTPAQIAAYLTEARETGDASFVYTAIDTITRAREMSKLTKRSV